MTVCEHPFVGPETRLNQVSLTGALIAHPRYGTSASSRNNNGIAARAFSYLFERLLNRQADTIGSRQFGWDHRPGHEQRREFKAPSDYANCLSESTLCRFAVFTGGRLYRFVFAARCCGYVRFRKIVPFTIRNFDLQSIC
jgi:hypothetical protein